MGMKPAERRGTRRIYWLVAGCFLTFTASIAAATWILWRRRLIHDAVSLGSYATAVLAVSTIVLFFVTALLAAATIVLVRTERANARREEEKYELERDAREEQERLRAAQAKVYGLQISELERRLADQERAQARAVHVQVATLTLVLPGAPARTCKVVRVDNRSHLPIYQARCTVAHADGGIEHAQPGAVEGPMTPGRLAAFTANPHGSVVPVIEPGRSAEFAFLGETEHADGNEPLVTFTDTAGLAWHLDAHLTLAKALPAQRTPAPLAPDESSQPPAAPTEAR
jgi:membrane protein implicated in regulation of membrane protease activity